jgi:hypothetical protein
LGQTQSAGRVGQMRRRSYRPTGRCRLGSCIRARPGRQTGARQSRGTRRRLHGEDGARIDGSRAGHRRHVPRDRQRRIASPLPLVQNTGHCRCTRAWIASELPQPSRACRYSFRSQSRAGQQTQRAATRRLAGTPRRRNCNTTCRPRPARACDVARVRSKTCAAHAWLLALNAYSPSFASMGRSLRLSCAISRSLLLNRLI